MEKGAYGKGDPLYDDLKLVKSHEVACNGQNGTCKNNETLFIIITINLQNPQPQTVWVLVCLPFSQFHYQVHCCHAVLGLFHRGKRWYAHGNFRHSMPQDGLYFLYHFCLVNANHSSLFSQNALRFLNFKDM